VLLAAAPSIDGAPLGAAVELINPYSSPVSGVLHLLYMFSQRPSLV
jgi:hypothetical protein